MEQQFDPPSYAWTAATAAEALDILDAARDLIGAHLKTFKPGNGMDRHKAAKTAPTGLRVELDLSGLVQAINDQHTVKALESSLDLPDICDCGRERQPGEDHSLCYPGMD